MQTRLDAAGRPSRSLRRLAILANDAAAIRLIQAVRELRLEGGAAYAELVTVALFGEGDRHARFVREADEAVALGSSRTVAGGAGRCALLEPAAVERGLLAARADAAWVGWGPLAERIWFAEMCQRLGLLSVGPSPEAMRALGDKLGAKRWAALAGIPTVPWRGGSGPGGSLASLAEALRGGLELGFPLMVKAAAGGGGRGIVEARAKEDLAAAYERARAEALAAFGDGRVFVEQRIDGVRHVEVQIVADRHGAVWAPGVRDGTVQYHFRKVVHEAPSPGLREVDEATLRDAATRLVRAAGYAGVATVEMLWDPAQRKFYLLEVNPRLPMEHALTEAVQGLDLVKLELELAAGGRLIGLPPQARGHAIEVRVAAEDPDRHFSPAPGRVELLRIPTGPGLRIDTGVGVGDDLAAGEAPQLVKITAHGADRDEALARLRRALADSAIALRGGATNKPFLLAVLAHPEMAAAATDTAWLDEVAAHGEHVMREHAEVALVQTALDVHDGEVALQRARLLTSAARGQPRVAAEIGTRADLRYRGRAYRLLVRCVGPAAYRVEADGVRLDVVLDRLGPFERRLRVAGRRFHVLSVNQGVEQLVEVEGVPHRIARDAAGIVRAPTPAVVLALPVAVGESVAAGDRVAVLEAMKMEVPVLAPFAGRIRQILVRANVQVDAGAALLVVEPHGVAVEAASASPSRVDFTSLGEPASFSPRERWRACREAIGHFLLGYDLDSSDIKHLLREWSERVRGARADDPELLADEDELLATFADVQALFRRRRDEDRGPAGGRSPQEYLLGFLRSLDGRGEGMPEAFVTHLRAALRHFGIGGLERTPELEECLVRLYTARARADEQVLVPITILERRLARRDELAAAVGEEFRVRLDHLIATARDRFPALHDLAREVRHRYLDEPLFERAREAVYARAEAALRELEADLDPARRAALMSELVECSQPLVATFLARLGRSSEGERATMLEALTRRYYRTRRLEDLELGVVGRSGRRWATGSYAHEGRRVRLMTAFADAGDLPAAWAELRGLAMGVGADDDVVADLYVWHGGASTDPDAMAASLLEQLERTHFTRPIRRLVVAIASAHAGSPYPGMGRMQHFTFRALAGSWTEERALRGLHPMMGKRMNLWRLARFEIERLPSAEDIYLFHATARENPKDERLFALAEVRDLTAVRDATGGIHLPMLEHMLVEAVSAIRRVQMARPPAERSQSNRVLLYVWPPLRLSRGEIDRLVERLAPLTEGVGLEQVVVRARIPDPATGELEDTLLRISNPGTQGLLVTFTRAPTQPLRPLGEYEQKVVSLRRRGLTYPYELIRMLASPREAERGDLPPGEFVEYDLDETGALAPVDRPWGQNRAHVVVGLIRSFTAKFPEGMERVVLLGDASKEMGSMAEPECRRILGALALARDLAVPVEWFALSAGAKISMESGTENMDWISRVLRGLIEFTQEGGEVNVVVVGINVGAQPYWNAEATMLMHTRGILVMTPEAAMVLTGKQALDYSGSVSAEDNFGIGGYERIMGPNGQAQYFARDLAQACQILLRHYDHTYIGRGDRAPRRAVTTDARERDVCASPHAPEEPGGFASVGDVLGEQSNPGRKKPFDIRRVMAAVVDQDQPSLERWRDMRDAETAVVWDAHLGGIPVCLIGMESHPVERLGFVPADGPERWTAGTLFPRSSKKVARAINATSGNRPLVVLANLSGFDGSPESMRNLQLEYGAEIGRAVVNFRGPIVFCVISRYHGGAFVVFSKALNESVEAAALEGTYASVIGGAPAAAVVFAREVETRTRQDPRVAALDAELAASSRAEETAHLRLRRAEVRAVVHSEKLGEVADEFDRVHSVGRAHRVGSLDRIIPARGLRPYLIDALERGLERA